MMGLFGFGLPRRVKHSRRVSPRIKVLRLECLEARLALSGLNLTFKVENPNYNTSNVYVTFIDGGLQATYDGGQAVQLNHSYSLDELKGPINLTNYNAGRVFISLGAGVAGDKPPEMVNPSIPSYNVRHDKFEITYNTTNANSVSNLTAVDFFGIPLELNTYTSGSSSPVDSLTYRISADTLTSELAALAGDSNQVLLTNNGQFLRVLAPHTTTATGIQYYRSLQPYIDYVKTWQTEGQPAHSHTTIEGRYEQNGSTARTESQDYYFLTTVESDGGLKLVGGGEKVGGGLWSGSNHTIQIAASGLAQGIYLGNVAWTVDGAAGSFNDNDVYAAAVRDILAGFNLGFVASATVDPNTGMAFGSESSKHWWSSTQAFEYLQPNNIFYNQYAQTVTGTSDAYSWAFSDRWSHVQAHLYGMQTLEVVVLPDTIDATTPGLYDGTASAFYLRNSNTSGSANTTFAYGPAGAGWTPIVGDWATAGRQTVGLYDPNASTFYLKNSNTTGYADVTFGFGPGGGGWKPIVGDWTHLGHQSVGLYDATNSTFYLRNSNTTGCADTTFGYGWAGLTPIAGDWNADGLQTVGLYDPVTSTFYLRNTNSSGYADVTFHFGTAGAQLKPIVGDWNGDGTDTVGLYSAANATFYLKNSNSAGDADITFRYGAAGTAWTPLVGNWTGVSSLFASGGAAEGSAVECLTQADVQPILDEAIARWVAVGLDAEAEARLRNVQVTIEELPDAQLGHAGSECISIDSTAAGHGWFIDRTPALDEEFIRSGASEELTAIDPQAVDRIDLQTVVEHELGHIAGFDDLDGIVGNLMANSLAAGIRRTV
jgi:hypothetical protein